MIPQIEPIIDEEELKEMTKVIKSTWLTEGKETKKFEDMFKELTKSKYALAFCNGTATLFTALKILGIKEGDEIIVPSITFVATINSILFANAKPVLVDIDKETFNIDPKKIEERITNKTKAIMPVHLYGQSADMDAIMKIAKKHNLKVIEDAAQGVGVKFKGKHVGTFGEAGSFSLYGNKTITSGEGGVFTTNNEEIAKDAYRMKNHGRDKKGIFIHEKIGFNFSYTDMQAAIAVVQMKKLNYIIKRKKEIREQYMKELEGIVEFTKIDERCTPVHWFTNILVKDVQGLSDFLKERNISSRRFFYPMHKQPCYNFEGEYPNAEYAYEHGLSLPSTASLDSKTISKICDAIKEFYQN